MTEQNIYKPKASGLIWFGSIAIGFAILALELYGAWMGFPFSTAVILSIVATIVALWGIFLTKYHDEPGEKFTLVSAVCKIVLLIATACAGIILFSVAREISTATETTQARAKIDKEKRESLVKASEGAGKQGKYQAAKGLAAMDTSYIEKPQEIFKDNEGKATAALVLNFAAFGLTFIAMFLAFIFMKTAKQTAAECGFNPNLVVNPLEQHRLSQIKFRDPNQAQTLQPVKTENAKGGGVNVDNPNMKDGMHYSEVEQELNRAHPNTPKGTRTEIEGTLYESNGQTWEAQGVYGAGSDAQAKVRTAGAGANMRTPSLPRNERWEPAIDANKVKRGTIIDGWECVRDNWWTNDSGENKWEYTGSKLQTKGGGNAIKHNSSADSVDSVSRHSRDTERESRDSVATGIEKIREALRTGYAKPGHFFFKAEDKTASRRNPGVLIRMMSYRQNGQEFELANHMFDVELMAFAENNDVFQIGEYMEAEMFENFDLGKEIK